MVEKFRHFQFELTNQDLIKVFELTYEEMCLWDLGISIAFLFFLNMFLSIYFMNSCTISYFECVCVFVFVFCYPKLYHEDMTRKWPWMVELKDRGFGWDREVQAFYCKGGKIRGFKVEGSKHPFTHTLWTSMGWRKKFFLGAIFLRFLLESSCKSSLDFWTRSFTVRKNNINFTVIFL